MVYVDYFNYTIYLPISISLVFWARDSRFGLRSIHIYIRRVYIYIFFLNMYHIRGVEIKPNGIFKIKIVPVIKYTETYVPRAF